MNERKTALLLLINAVLLFAFGTAVYYGYLAYLWDTDASKLSFLIIALYFGTAGVLAFGKHREAVVQEIADVLPGVALIGTTFGIILVLSALAKTTVTGGNDFKALIEPILIGAGTAFQPTLLGVAASVLLRFQLLLR